MTNRILSDLAGLNIRTIRKERGWTVAELAERCARIGAEDLTASAITNIELGRRDRRVTVDELAALAEALMVTPAVLVPVMGASYKFSSEDDLEILLKVQLGNMEVMRVLVDRIRSARAVAGEVSTGD